MMFQPGKYIKAPQWLVILVGCLFLFQMCVGMCSKFPYRFPIISLRKREWIVVVFLNRMLDVMLICDLRLLFTVSCLVSDL